MELVSSNHENLRIGDHHTPDAAVTFSEHVLNSVLDTENSRITVNPLEQISDWANGISTLGTLHVAPDQCRITAKQDKTEISIAGSVKNREGMQEIFTFFCVLWWHGPTPGNIRHKETRNNGEMIINFADMHVFLPDTVFELAIEPHNLATVGISAKGRGFILFGRKM